MIAKEAREVTEEKEVILAVEGAIEEVAEVGVVEAAAELFQGIRNKHIIAIFTFNNYILQGWFQ